MSNLYRVAFLSLLQAAIVGLSGCGRAPPNSSSAPAAPTTSTGSTDSTNASVDDGSSGKPPVLSDAEVRFGSSVEPNSQITYQPDVIVLARGAEAIKSQSPDGFSWTLDANAPGASGIQRDKILFATGRIVGRVLKLERRGADLAVTLGPVELTDVFKEAHISYQGTLNPADAIVYLAPPDYPGTYLDRNAPAKVASNTTTARRRHDGAVQVFRLSANGDLIPLPSVARLADDSRCVAEPSANFRLMQTVYRGAEGDFFGRETHCGDRAGNGIGGTLRVSDGAHLANTIANVLLGGFDFSPDVAGGLGVTLRYPAKNAAISPVEYVASIKLRLEQPKFTFKLDISQGVKTAVIELKGLGGLDVSLNGRGTTKVQNVNSAFNSPYDISFPLVKPFAATYHQSLTFETMFTGKEAVVSAQGQYEFGGLIRAGIENGQPTGAAPVFAKMTKNLAATLSGESPAVNGLVIAYGGKLIVGIGSFGFVVGPFASINSSIGITRGSDLQVPIVGYTCRSADLKFWLDYGLGLAIPKWTADALSFVVGIFGGKPVSSAYTKPLGTLPITSRSDGVPPNCASAAG